MFDFECLHGRLFESVCICVCVKRMVTFNAGLFQSHLHSLCGALQMCSESPGDSADSAGLDPEPDKSLTLSFTPHPINTDSFNGIQVVQPNIQSFLSSFTKPVCLTLWNTKRYIFKIVLVTLFHAITINGNLSF